jgi:anaerobic selenocysteine-containing dehydrogenase
MGGEFPVAALAEEMTGKEEDRIRGFICLAGNPVLSTPNGRLMDEGLANLDFMVAMDWYVTETSRHADFILPPTHMLEHDHYPIISEVACIRNMAKYSPPVFSPDRDSRHGWQIIRELAISMTKNPIRRNLLKVVTPERLLKMGFRFGPYGSGLNPFKKGLTLKKVSRSVHGIDLGPMVPRLPDRLFTADKKIQLAPEMFVSELNNLEKKENSKARGIKTEFDLLLVTRRNVRSNNSWFHNLERMKKDNRCTAWVNSSDAAARKLEDGDRVRLSSGVGSIDIEIEITDSIMPGVISAPHGWGHNRDGVELSVAAKNPGVSLNDITDNRVIDTICGGAVFSGVPVSITKMET